MTVSVTARSVQFVPGVGPFQILNGPKIGITCEYASMISDVEFTLVEFDPANVARASIAQSIDGDMDVYHVLSEALKYCGFDKTLTDPEYAKSWLASHTTLDAAKTILKWWNEVAVPQINKELAQEFAMNSAAPVVNTGASAADPTALINFLLSQGVISVGPDGKTPVFKNNLK